MKRLAWVLCVLEAGAQTVGPPPRPRVDPIRPDAVSAPATVKPRSDAPRGAPSDPFKTGVDESGAVRTVVRASSSELSVADMLCEIYQFSHDTRSVTCGISANQTSYSGVLIVYFEDGSVWSRSVFVEQPMIAGRMATWGIAVVPAYGSTAVTKVEFANGQPLATWDQTEAARATLEGTYNYGKAAYYPPPVAIGEMTCHVSEFLVGKSQAGINPTYVWTCAFAGDQRYYGGSVAVWWHQFESRIAAPGTPLPVPAVYSTRDTAQHSQYVRVAHDVFGSELSYWGLAAFGVELAQRIAYDRMQFYPEREASSFASELDVPAPPPPQQNWFQKIFFRNKKPLYIR